jgi:aldehyde:ferredoxin oxidoreductase
LGGRLAKEASLFDSPISLNIAIMKGFSNQLLRFNLSHQKSTVEPIPESILRSYLGGKGLGSYLLLKESPPRIDLFSPEDRPVITLDPLADTPFYGSSRYAVFTKSPQQEDVTKKEDKWPRRFFREVL